MEAIQQKPMALKDLRPDVGAVSVILEQAARQGRLRAGHVILHVTPEGKLNVTQMKFQPAEENLWTTTGAERTDELKAI